MLEKRTRMFGHTHAAVRRQLGIDCRGGWLVAVVTLAGWMCGAALAPVSDVRAESRVPAKDAARGALAQSDPPRPRSVARARGVTPGPLPGGGYLAVGSSPSNEVRSVQQLLRSAGLPTSPDGKFGRRTEAAVVRFQRRHKLLVDGVVGRQTMSALRAIPARAASTGAREDGRRALSSGPEPTQARPADSFVDSIGVNVHMTYLDTAYRDRPRLVDKLASAGIRHVRDGLVRDTEYAYTTFNQLADRGIRTTFIMGDPSQQTGTLDQLVAVLKSKILRTAAAVEGPNEYHHGRTPPWYEEVRSHQRRLFAAVKNDAALSHLPVLAPSGITWQDYRDLGDLRDVLDFGNKHPYPGGEPPEGNLGSELSVAATVSGNKAVQATESGYHNALATTSGHRPTSEEATATYLPRMYLEYFRRGIPRTFAYELIDEWPDAEKKNSESNFGLLRNDYSEKPAFRNLRNLIALLSDRGGSHSLEPLNLSSEGAPPDLRKLVLQKRDGSYYVVLWRTVRVWDPVARKALTPDTRTATVSVPGATSDTGDAEVFSPSRSSERIATAPLAGGVRVSLSADPIVVRLPAAAAVPAPAPQTPVTRTPAPRPSRTPPRPSPPRPASPQPASVPRRASPSPSAPAPRITVPSRQRLNVVLRRGLVVECRAARRSVCRAAMQRNRAVLARGQGSLWARDAVRFRLRLSSRGRRDLRRAGARGRAVSVRVRASVGAGRERVVRVLLRPSRR